MRASTVRAVLAALGLLGPGGACVLVACAGGSHGTSSGGADASEASTGAETGAQDGGDSSVPHDASTADVSDTGTDADAAHDADAGSAEAGDAGPSDAGLDTAPEYPDGSGFAGDCGVGPAGEPTELRCTGLYSDWAAKTVSSDMQPYDPGLHLWSDGADKMRWIHLPPGQKIDTTDMNEWTFPVGTKVFKEFSLRLGDASTDTRIETRLLWKVGVGVWYRTTYRWTDDGVSGTTELTAGQFDAGGTGYEVPTQDECNQCHNGRKDGVLGFEAVSLSSPGASGLTIQALAAESLLTAPPTAPIVVPGDAVESAALGYLHANCGVSCHNRAFGQAFPSGFFMRLDVATLASAQTTDTYTTGWNQLAQNFTIPDAGTTYRLHACDIGSSGAYFRDSHRAGVDGIPAGVQMPPVDTHVIDDAGLAALAAWINEGCDAGHD